MTLNKTIVKAVLALSVVAMLSGCANWSRKSRNTAIGAGIGAIGGSVLTHGDGLGTLGGAALGGIIGNQTSN